MYEIIKAVNPDMCVSLEQNNGDTLFHLMGKIIEGYTWEDLVKMWCISGQTISEIYFKLIKSTCRSGIG